MRATAANGYLDIVKLLLEKGADVNSGDNESLRKAAMNGYSDIVDVLLKAGANPNAVYLPSVKSPIIIDKLKHQLISRN